MVNDTEYHRAGIPITLLGCKWTSWWRDELRRVIQHHDVQVHERTSKLELMRTLDRLREQHNLTWEDRRSILNLRGPVRYPQRPKPSTLQRHIPHVLENVSPSGENQTPIPRPPARKVTFATDLPPSTVVAAINNEAVDVECSVCLESLSVDVFPKRKITSFCKHEQNICLSCLRQSIGA